MKEWPTRKLRLQLVAFSKNENLAFREIDLGKGGHLAWALQDDKGRTIWKVTVGYGKTVSPGVQRDMIAKAEYYIEIESRYPELNAIRKRLVTYLRDVLSH